MTIFEYPKKFWYEATDRAIKTVLQVMVVAIPVTAAVDEIPWWGMFLVAAPAGITSLITSVVSGQVGEKGTASIIEEPVE
jgi:hypothetical protein